MVLHYQHVILFSTTRLNKGRVNLILRSEVKAQKKSDKNIEFGKNYVKYKKYTYNILFCKYWFMHLYLHKIICIFLSNFPNCPL